MKRLILDFGNLNYRNIAIEIKCYQKSISSFSISLSNLKSNLCQTSNKIKNCQFTLQKHLVKLVLS